MRKPSLLDRDFKIVEKKKIFFLIPTIIVAIALICGIIYGFVFGSPFNLGMDFSGGYTMNVKLGTKLTDGTYNDYRDQITDIVSNLKNENGESYNLKVSNMQRQNSGAEATIYVKYKAVGDEEMMQDEVNPALQEALEADIFNIIPELIAEDGKLTFEYDMVILANYDNIMSTLSNAVTKVNTSNSAAITGEVITLSEDKKGIVLSFTSANMTDEVKQELKNLMTIDDMYSGMVSTGDIVGAAVSGELLWTAILSVILAIMLMLVYIAFRFELLSGVAAIIALFHDILIMFCFMIITRMEFTSTFIAALITILGYSINNTIIIFDRVRENSKALNRKAVSGALIINKSVKETIWRSINTTLTTLIMIAMVAIIGVTDIRVFAAPIIVGLLSGTYSSIFIAPSVWASWKDRKRKSSPQGILSEKAAVSE